MTTTNGLNANTTQEGPESVLAAMNRPHDDDINPYQAPGTNWDSPVRRKKTLSKTAKRLKRFRQQCHGLGGLWVLMGLATVGLGLVVELDRAFGGDWHSMAGLAVVLDGVFGVVLGIGVCLKRRWAIASSLLLGYAVFIAWPLVAFSLFASAIWAATVCIFGVLVLIVAIRQAHRIRHWAKQLEEDGIPLNARPDDVDE